MKNCYWITTDEPLLREEAADKVRRAARKQGYTRHIFDIDARFDWNAFKEQTRSLSLFSEKKIIECRLQHGRLHEPGVKAINAFLDENIPDTCVLLVSPKLEPSAKKTKWFKQLSERIDMQILWPPQGPAFLQFLKQRANHYQLKLTPEALQCLADFTEGNLLAAKQILQQLAISHTDVNLEAVQTQLHDASKFDVYQLVDTALSGQASKVASIFYKLLEEGTPPAILLWALHREVTQLRQNKSPAFGPRKALVQNAQKRLDPALLANMTPKFAKVDQLIKSQSADEGLNQLLDLYIVLSGAKINLYEIDT